MFQERTALVVGASRGIGRAIALGLASRGARVCVTARDHDAAELESVRQELDAFSPAMARCGSSDDEEHRARVATDVVEEFGSLDLLVVSAGTNPQYGPVIDADLSAVEKVLRVNAVAPLGWAQEAWRTWMQDHGGAILNVSSINARRNIRSIGAYNMSKSALTQLTRQLALELAPTVRVNAIEPGVVRTRFAEALYDGREEEAAAVYPLGRLGLPDDIASAACYLLGDDASWVTGASLVVDGGVLLVPPE